MIRFHLLRAEESRPHLDALRARMRGIFPNMNPSKADRLLAILDEEVTRANIRWFEMAMNVPNCQQVELLLTPDENPTEFAT